MKILGVAILAAVFTVACAHKPSEVIVTRDVNIAVPVPCTVELKGQRPKLLTLPELRDQLAAAPNVDSRAKIITEQLLAHIGWLPVVEDAMKGCKMEQSALSK